MSEDTKTRVTATVSTTVQVSSDTKRLCARLQKERMNPPHLRANLDRVVHLAMARLDGMGIRTTYESAVTTLGYIAQGSYDNRDDVLADCLLDAITRGGDA